MPLRNGDTIWETVTPTLLVNSPVLGPWVETSGVTQALGWLAVAGGTTVVTVEYGTDGSRGCGSCRRSRTRRKPRSTFVRRRDLMPYYPPDSAPEVPPMMPQAS